MAETDFDHWNGGTTTYTVYLRVDSGVYPPDGKVRQRLQEQIAERFREVVRADSKDWFVVELVPVASSGSSAPHAEEGVSRSTRNAIFDVLRLWEIDWSGNLSEVDFLERVYRLGELPSSDRRFASARDDVWQHRINNPDDWPDDWVFTDQRFDLVGGPFRVFLSFLCEMVHPVVRADPDEVARLVREFNDHLVEDGWNLVPARRIGGRPSFIAHRVGNGANRAIARVSAAATVLDAEWMRKEIDRMEAACDSDPALAIGTAKDLIETCCKSILTLRDVAYSRSDDLPGLTRKVAKELALVPAGISESAKGADKIRLILQNLVAVSANIAELRGLYGSGHGRDGKYRGLQPRHARLAVGAAAVFVDFVTSTHEARKEAEG